MVDDDADGLIDCLDTDCLSDGKFVCGVDGYLVPACQPLLDDPTRMIFKMPRRMDLFKVNARGILTSDIAPDVEYASFLVANVDGVIYSESFEPGSFTPNSRGTVFKFRRLRDRVTPGMFNFVIKPKYVAKTDTHEVILKPKMEEDFWMADPLRNTTRTEAQLATMTVQISIGDDAFFITAPFERKSNGWSLRDKYMVSP